MIQGDFLAKVVSFTPVPPQAVVLPLIMELDGTPHVPVTAAVVGGITPDPGDTVLVVLVRNDLDGSRASRLFEATEANGRVVAVVIPVSGTRTLTGSYKIEGSLSVDGSLMVTGDTTLTGNLDATGNVGIGGNVSVDGNMSVEGTLTTNGIVVNTHGHISAPPGYRTGNMVP